MLICCRWLLVVVALTVATSVIFLSRGAHAAIAVKPRIISITTTVQIPDHSPSDVHRYLATPSHWPHIVLSSVAVQAPLSQLGPVQSNRNPSDDKQRTSTQRIQRLDVPMQWGDVVEEVFGLPYILPLSVTWTCVQSDVRRGQLDVKSVSGVNGLARNCRMYFDVQQDITDRKMGGSDGGVQPRGTMLNLTMEYEPINPLLGRIAAPLLTLDNAIALKVLLPWQLSQQRQKHQKQSALDKFRSLMGNVYGIAGLAHAVDVMWGGSQLLIASGCPPYEQLPPMGQLLVAVWCLSGPMAYYASRTSGYADLGIVLYGLIEVGCALVVVAAYPMADLPTSTAISTPTINNPLINAILVQILVTASWIYASQQPSSPSQSNQSTMGR